VLEQSWPIENQSRDEEAYVTGDSIGTHHYAGVLEPYWINSDGFAIHASRDNSLFVSINSTRDRPGELCLIARNAKPYPILPAGTADHPVLKLRYTICSAPNLRAVHQIATENFWHKPRAVPSQRMLTYPIWSTWAQYKSSINQSLVADFAAKIREHGFDYGQLEIDDKWEPCYGQMTFDPVKFPDPALMVQNLHQQDFLVTLWVHPFINLECDDFIEASAYVVKDAKGVAGLTKWWDTESSSAYFDFTSRTARKWWNARITRIKSDYGFDGFKFDAGETNWMPNAAYFSKHSPNTYSTSYASNMQLYGGLTEVRTGWGAQDVPIFFRMLDKDSNWDYNNGLKTLIPTLLQFGIEGYPFVLPDMIGGNGYGFPPERELFIRWMQANVFMPAMQFSYTPWDYDQEAVDIGLKMTALHVQYADVIGQLALQATRDGSPINRPVWWIDPTNPDAQAIDSEFLLGDTLLVAPVLEKGAVTRDIFLPRGHWRDENNQSQVWTGPTWLLDYPAPLDALPYFTCVDC